MSKESRRQKIRWLEHALWVLGTWTALGIALVVIAVWSGLANPLLRRALMQRLESVTNAKVDIRTVSVGWFSLDATIRGLVVHGKEPADTEPLFSVEQARVGLRIDSLWGRRFSVGNVVLTDPRLHILIDKTGKSNLPPPRNVETSAKPWNETVLGLHMRSLRVENGWVLVNNLRRLVALEGGELNLDVKLGGSWEEPLYLGNLTWNSIQIARRRDMPVPGDLSVKFTLWQKGITVEQCVLNLGRSQMDAQAEMTNFTDPKWTYKYRAWVDLLDLREGFRTPEIPLGRVDLRGEGEFSGDKTTGKGSFIAENLTLGFQDFHSQNLTARTNYVLDEKKIVLPDFVITAIGGTVKSKVTMLFDGLYFRAESKLSGLQLSRLFPAIDHPGFPIDKLRWDAVVSGDVVETWREAFHEFEVAGTMKWRDVVNPAPGHFPVNADWQLRYRMDSNILDLQQLSFQTQFSRGTMTGTLDPKNSDLDVHFETAALDTWEGFYHAIAGDPPDPPGTTHLGGHFVWDGKILGPSDGPTLQGHLRAEQFRYGDVALDVADTDLTYSPTQLLLSRARARKGAMDASVEAQLQLTDWSFLPESEWTGEVSLEKVPLQGMEQLAGAKYPVTGFVTGQFHGRGTRAEPSLTGLFDIAEGNAYGLRFNRLRGQLNAMPDEVRLSNAELRFFEPGTEKTGGAGIVTGSASYRFADKSLTTDLVGAAIPLANLEKLQGKAIALGGQLTFRLKSSGSVLHPEADGSFRVVDLSVGSETIGSFDGALTANGSTAQLRLGSAMSEGAITGLVSMGLADPYPVDGRISIANFNLDPYLLSALHLEKFNGHGIADGTISITGEVAKPETIELDAKFSKVQLTYGKVLLENDGPIELRSTQDSLRIVSATLKGAATNAQLSGNISFTGRRVLDLRLNGSLDLQLISAYIPDFDMTGHAVINTSVTGTLDRPRIVGRVQLKDATARSTDFPTGLSNIKGDLVFDANSLFFDNVTAEAGGGQILLAGNVNYAERPIRYEVTAKTDRIRIRYPEGISWLTAGNLRLSGTLNGGLLSGKVQVQRVNLNEGLESAGVLVSAGDSGGSTSSYFLRNLQFDIEVSSTPDSRLEWPGAQLEAEANLRVRGTAEHPILLGHIHVLSGELFFRDSRYRVTRGDLNFANPFQLNPVINVEATTNIQQYEITLNFSGKADKLNLSYRSDPPLPANDIITLLTMGQATTEASLRSGGLAQGGTAGASALISEAISSQLGGRVERLFGITRFRVDPGLAGVGSTGSEQNAAARITVEQQVTRNLSIIYISNVSSTQQQVIEVDYTVNKNISVVGLRDQNGTFGVDIKIKKRLP